MARGEQAIRCIVSGTVQAVYFRASTQQQAIQAGVTGWVRNMPDGRVEVYACGTAEALDRFRSWLAQGPERAKVEAVHCVAAQYEDLADFSIRY